MMISAGKPGKVFCALAKYFPSGEILMAKFGIKKYMRFCYHDL